MLHVAHTNTPEVAVGTSFSVRTLTIWRGDELTFIASNSEPVVGIVVYASPLRISFAIGADLFVCRRRRLMDNIVLKLLPPTSSWTVTDRENYRSRKIR